MALLLAPDKFKGTLTAAEVAAAMAAGAGADAVRCPIADGGDGTATILLDALGGEWRTAPAHDAIGRPIEARYAVLADGSAVVDVAEASGMARLDAAECLCDTAASFEGALAYAPQKGAGEEQRPTQS